MVLGGFLAELASLIWIGSRVGVFNGLLLVLAGFAGGTFLIRYSGLSLFKALSGLRENGGMPSPEPGSAFLLMIAGLLFILPGFFSDILGALLLIPPLRRRIALRLTSPFQQSYRGRPDGPTSGVIIEGEAIEVSGELMGSGGRHDDRPR